MTYIKWNENNNEIIWSADTLSLNNSVTISYLYNTDTKEAYNFKIVQSKKIVDLPKELFEMDV